MDTNKLTNKYQVDDIDTAILKVLLDMKKLKNWSKVCAIRKNPIVELWRRHWSHLWSFVRWLILRVRVWSPFWRSWARVLPPVLPIGPSFTFLIILDSAKLSTWLKTFLSYCRWFSNCFPLVDLAFELLGFFLGIATLEVDFGVSSDLSLVKHSCRVFLLDFAPKLWGFTDVD